MKKSICGCLYETIGEISAADLGAQSEKILITRRVGDLSGRKFIAKYLPRTPANVKRTLELVRRQELRELRPYVCVPHDAIELHDSIVSISDFATGVSLDKILPTVTPDDRSRLPPIVAHSVALCVAHGVAGMEAKNLMLGDISDRNTMYDPNSGLAALIDCDAATGQGLPGSEMMGSVGYIAPEVSAGGIKSDRTEVYALGSLVHRTLLAVDPFAQQVGSDLMIEEIQLREWQFDPSRNPACQYMTSLHPVFWQDLFPRALSPDPRKRPHAVEFFNALRHIVLGGRLVECWACQMPFHLHQGRRCCPHCQTGLGRVIELPDGTTLVVEEGRTISIGRDECAAASQSISREQVELTVVGGRLYMKDVSRYGNTFAQSVDQSVSTPVGGGTVLLNGGSTFYFEQTRSAFSFSVR